MRHGEVTGIVGAKRRSPRKGAPIACAGTKSELPAHTRYRFVAGRSRARSGGEMGDRRAGDDGQGWCGAKCAPVARPQPAVTAPGDPIPEAPHVPDVGEATRTWR